MGQRQVNRCNRCKVEIERRKHYCLSCKKKIREESIKKNNEKRKLNNALKEKEEVNLKKKLPEWMLVRGTISYGANTSGQVGAINV